MPCAGVEKRLPLLGCCAEQVAEQKHGFETATEIELLDPRADRLCVAYVLEHLGRLIDGDDVVADPHERARDASRAAAELEQRRRRRQRSHDELTLTALLELCVELDGTAVGRSRHAIATATSRRSSGASGPPSAPSSATSANPAETSSVRSSSGMYMRRS